VLRRDGARWVAEATFDPLNATRAGQLEGLIAALAGSVNTVRITDWRREFRTGDPRSQGQVPTGPYSCQRPLNPPPMWAANIPHFVA